MQTGYLCGAASGRQVPILAPGESPRIPELTVASRLGDAGCQPAIQRTASSRYAVAIGIENDRGEPAVELGIEGNDGQKRFVLGHADVDR